MKNALNSIKVATPATNAFDLSHNVKFSAKMGLLYPILAMECIPGDRFRLGCENLVRVAPLVAPVMERFDVRAEYFFVPNRLIWKDWEIWITNGGDQPDPEDPLPSHPFFKYAKVDASGIVGYNTFPLLDYMGLPDPDQTPEDIAFETISALPFGAYQKIYDDYYRDENLIDSNWEQNEFPCADGDNFANQYLFELKSRCWEADYFTKALPWAQKGTPVDLPIGAQTVHLDPSPHPFGIVRNLSGSIAPPGELDIEAATGALIDNGGAQSVYDPNGSLVVDGTATTINDLRTAYRLQEWLEKNARGGTRYSELIRSHFAVTPQDSRLQRAEYIVGVKNPIQISEVLNTSGVEGSPVQGTMAGHGISYANGNYGKYFCQEHGYIICMFSVMPKPSYQQGIPKHFLKYTDPTQLAWPSFANLGEQPIEEREIMAFTDPDEIEPTFGYTPRYMEYKTLPNRSAGQFKTTLDFWTATRIFDKTDPPVLNDQFVKADPTKRFFAVEDPTVDDLYCQCYHHIVAVRRLPFYGTPTF